MLKKCFGIISYFPPIDKGREKRITRFNHLLKQLNDLWPTIDILIIAQAWEDYVLPNIKNKIEVIKYEKPLKIVNARHILRQEFLKRNYDYIILLDDDALIKYVPEVTSTYMNTIDEHPNGFAFIKGSNQWFQDYMYAKAPLNLCAISRFIFEKQDFVHVELEESDALEDDVYAYLLHRKFSTFEFDLPLNIQCIQYEQDQYKDWVENPNEAFPSTWFNKNSNKPNIRKNTYDLLLEINRLNDLPNMEDWYKNKMRK